MTGKPYILIATDLSARCDRPLDRAFLLADQLDGFVLLVHVAADKPLPQVKEELVRDFIRRDLGARADEAEVVIAYGSVPSTIARIACERDARVIVAGVGRMNEVRDYFVGTAVDYLVRQSPVPVLVVKQRARAPYERLLGATDFSPSSRMALETAAEMFPAAQLRLVHAYHAAFAGFLNATQTAAFVREEADRMMESFVQQLPDALKNRLQTCLAEGELSSAVQDLLRSWSADLLVLGTHGSGGFAHATVGSRTAELLACEPVDMLVVRPER